MFITPDASPESASSEPLKVVVALSSVVRLGPGFGWSCIRSLKTGIPLPACGVTAAQWLKEKTQQTVNKDPRRSIG